MNTKQCMFLCLLIISHLRLYGMKKTTSRIQPSIYTELVNYSGNFLQENKHRLACQKNESGFIRINIPILAAAKSKFHEIKKLRLNYWSPDTGVTIRPESIHTHPNYFESLIIKGGYTHELYEEGENKDPEYDLYRIIKNGDKKSFVFIGQSKLKYQKNESIDQNTIVTFNKDLIHRVMHTTPETLSLNAIFNDGEDEDTSAYNVYLTRHATLDDVKTTRDILLSNQSKRFINEIMSIIAERKKA